MRKYVTMDETWIHHFTPESERQSAEWTVAGKSRPKRPKTKTLAGKVLASVFWDAQGILFFDYLEKGRTINSEYYIALLVRLKDEIAKKTASNEEERALLPRRRCSFTKKTPINNLKKLFLTKSISNLDTSRWMNLMQF